MIVCSSSFKMAYFRNTSLHNQVSSQAVSSCRLVFCVVSAESMITGTIYQLLVKLIELPLIRATYGLPAALKEMGIHRHESYF
ncbi:hypothetical protein [Paenibacillus durus]|uniref:Uncharacterized protein n=1 Tax=Paenibacillus durus ATCC 35681 TaxID=1333534 RepID=A0A0F7CH90_PAEDU|nr:hypothetical protein [Paenibacillus durus]AKG34221.1 hypothetical protein VK70_06240 [Paenibacillus durus ATCC 35681]